MFNLTDNKRINWKYQKLGNLGVFKTSSIDKIIKDNQRLVKLVNYMDVYNKIRFDISCLNRLSKTSVNDKQFLESNLKKGDILFTPSSETPDDIGHSAVIFDDLPNTVYSYHLVRFRPNFQFDLKFSNYFCNNSSVFKQMYVMSQGATRFTLSLPNFENIIVSYPTDLNEQHKIGSFLSALDKMIELRQKSLSLIKQELDYRINNIIGKINLKSFNKNKIGELFKISVGGDIPKAGYSENKDQIFKYPIFSNSLVNNGLYGYSKTFTKLKNSITVTGRGEIGKAVVRRENYYPIVRLLSLAPMFELDLNYFAYIINKIKIFNDQTGVPQLTAPKLSNYEIFYVSDINIQKKIGNIIEEKERIINLYQKQIIEFQKYKSYYLDGIFN
jgi:restriction endonuclease S subunit